MARRRLTGDEKALWHSATDDVRPLRSQAARAPEEAPRHGRHREVNPPSQVHRDFVPPPINGHAARPLPALTAGETIGLDRRRMERLKRGRLEIDGVVDLHGLTQEAAHRRIERYVHESVTAGRRCILVITGKGAVSQGGGILRRRLVEWLNAPSCRPYVVAFVQAQPNHGGSGAFYVLLKRQRDR